MRIRRPCTNSRPATPPRRPIISSTSTPASSSSPSSSRTKRCTTKDESQSPNPPSPASAHRLARSDAYLIAFWVASFWFLREATMRWIWSPLARICGVKEGKAVVRFAEQGWSMLYCQSLLSLCVVLRSNYNLRFRILVSRTRTLHSRRIAVPERTLNALSIVDHAILAV